MRDVIVMSVVLMGAIAALRFPWIGVMLWTWVSIMNPHRYTYGFAYDAPVAAIAAGATLIGLLLTRERESPFKGPQVTVFLLFFIWMTISWQAGFDPDGDYYQWNKVTKVYFMIFIALALLHSKSHIMALMWVCAGSLALLGAKGGIFTITGGGGQRVYGPPGTFIEDNNEFAVALIMIIPLLRFLQSQLQSKWGRRLMTLAMLLVAVSALGSQSRGGLLAIVAMGMLLWWRATGRRLRMAIFMVPVVVAMLAFMPESWYSRMETIESYQDDGSAMGRINAWWVAWGIAKHYVLGAGMSALHPQLFALYSPYPEIIPQVAHSIYFQILGHHGFIGLLLWLSIWIGTWIWAGKLRSEGPNHPQTLWCAEMGSMIQVSLLGYFVGGAFLSLAYFDLPYNLVVMVVLAKRWMDQQAWKTEPAPTGSRWEMPGLAGPKPLPLPSPARAATGTLDQRPTPSPRP
jgi:probable O-glycosylation ligase (exosortase A-associated)